MATEPAKGKAKAKQSSSEFIIGPIPSVTGDMAWVIDGIVGDPIPDVADGWYVTIRVRSDVPLIPGERVSAAGMPLLGHGNNCFRVQSIINRRPPR